jgi:hypothetical protein
MVARGFSLSPLITRSTAICWRNFAANSDTIRGAPTSKQRGREQPAERRTLALTNLANQLIREIETDELRPTVTYHAGASFPARDHNRGYLLFPVIHCCLQ